GTALPIPADAAPGDYAVVGTDENGAEITAPLEITAASDTCSGDPAVTVSPASIQAGATVTVTGTGFEPGTTATVTLVDSAGEQAGEQVTVEVGDDCGFAFEAMIRTGTAPGDYQIVAEDEAGNSASADLTVVDSTGSGSGSGGDGDGGLVNTGGDLTPMIAAIALLVMGMGGLAFIARRRTRVEQNN
ncbi:MAG: hypothetical protein ACTH31_12515, partial [Pseudoclavibacter sp.]